MLTLVLLPGMDGTGTLFGPFLEAIGSELRVNVVRYSATEPMGYGELETFARAALPREGPFVILGESFSGPLAVSLAAGCSSQLKGLILCCTFVRNPRPVLSALKPLLPVLPVKMVPTAVLSHFLLGAFSSDALDSTLAKAIAPLAPSVLRERLQAVLSVNLSAQLSALNLPILYLGASHDRVVPRAASDLVARLNPRVRMVQIGGPHFLLQAAAPETARVVREFIHQVENAV